MLRFAMSFWIAFGLSSDAAFAGQNVVWPEDQRIDFLRHYYSVNQSDRFLDLWESQNLRSITISSGLRDTHTLFINCHGKAVKTSDGTQFVLYPHRELLTNALAVTPIFYIEDLPLLLGNTDTARIHNVVLSACNTEGALDLTTIRAAFVNVTNIIHAPAGQEGYQPMLFQMLLNRSSRVETLYELGVKNKEGELEYEISTRHARGAKKLPPYVAALFAPGAVRPYRTQIAGRELLLPSSPSIASLP